MSIINLYEETKIELHSTLLKLKKVEEEITNEHAILHKKVQALNKKIKNIEFTYSKMLSELTTPQLNTHLSEIHHKIKEIYDKARKLPKINDPKISIIFPKIVYDELKKNRAISSLSIVIPHTIIHSSDDNLYPIKISYINNNDKIETYYNIDFDTIPKNM